MFAIIRLSASAYLLIFVNTFKDDRKGRCFSFFLLFSETAFLSRPLAIILSYDLGKESKREALKQRQAFLLKPNKNKKGLSEDKSNKVRTF